MDSPKLGFESSLCALISGHGLAEQRVQSLARHLIVHYPWVRRIGFEAAAGQLEQEGLEPAVARELTLELLAFELLGRLPYERVLGLVAERTDPEVALGACLSAVRVRRAVRARSTPEASGPLRARLLRVALSLLR